MSNRNFTNRAIAYKTLLVSAALVLSSFSVRAGEEEVLRPSQLNSNPQFYDGRDIVVRGYSFLGPEQNFLMESAAWAAHNRKKWERGEGGPSDDDKYCLSIVNPGFLLKKANNSWGLTHHILTLRGRFIAHYHDNVIDPGACPIMSGILVDQLVKAKK